MGDYQARFCESRRGEIPSGHSTTTEHTAKTPSPKTGLFATLRAFRHVPGSGAPSHRRVRLAFAPLLSLLVLALTAVPSLAAQAHIFNSSFGSAGSGDGQLALLAYNSVAGSAASSNVAVDDSGGLSQGDLYVTDTLNHRVEKFNAAGEFVLAFGADVGGPGVNTCTASCVAGTSGSRPGAFEAPTFIAVDNSSAGLTQGDVYVADSSTNLVQKFDSSGKLIATWGVGGQLDGSSSTAGPFGQIAGITVGSTGTLYVLGATSSRAFEFAQDGSFSKEVNTEFAQSPAGMAVDSAGDIYKVRAGGPVAKLGPSGTEVLAEQVDPGPASGLAVDPASDELYVAHSDHIARYSPSGVALESEIGISEGLGDAAGVAVDSASKTVYSLDPATNQVDAFPLLVLPDVAPGAASTIRETTATLNGEVNPAGIAVTGCQFEYVTEAAFAATGFSDLSSGGSAPCEEPGADEIGSGEEPVHVHADLTGLSAATAYRFRLEAANSNGKNHSQSLAFVTNAKPGIDSTSVSEVTAAAATLDTELNPHGLPTTYHFEYDTLSYTGNGAPHGTSTPPASVAAGGGDVFGSALVEGLSAGTTYYFRVVAENLLGSVAGPERSFTTQGTQPAPLQDGRSWELVSPPDKNGIPLEAMAEEGADIQAAADGSGFAYAAVGPIDPQPPGSRSVALTQLLAHRSAAGWSTQDIATPHQAPAGIEPGLLSEYHLFSTDLSLAALEPVGATPLSPLTTEHTPYLRQPTGEYTPLLIGCPAEPAPCPAAIAEHADVPPGTAFGGTEVLPERFQSDGVALTSGTTDLAHVVLESKTALTPGFAGGRNSSVYEWSAGALQLLSQVPPGAGNRCGGSGPACVPAAEAHLVSALGYRGVQVRNAISADGSRAVFATESENGGEVQLWLRDRVRGETVQLDAPAPGALGGSGAALFQTASADGSRIFFTDDSRLTADSTAEPGNQGKVSDLYMCKITEVSGHLACTLTDLSVDHNPGESAEVRGDVIGASEDGSVAYFVANGALTTGEGAVHGNCAYHLPTPEQICNLYRYDVATSTTKLVAVVSGGDENDWLGHGDEDELGNMTARVSPDGRWLAFMSRRSLTGYDNRDAHSGQPDQEVYLYDSLAQGGAGEVRCASCNPSGARPDGFVYTRRPIPLVDRPQLWTGQWLAASIPGWTRASLGQARYQSRYLSDSGRLFFNAHDALAPQDSNGTEDVYQYEPPGVGGCVESGSSFSAASGGCVDLVSSGTSGEESAFLDASESGDDVFFLTASKLAPQDLDSALDVYDAHVCSAALPCPPAPAPAPPACEGDSCQQTVSPPNDPTPGSLTFRGAGNLVPPAPAVKPKVKPLTRAQLLARALKACRAKHDKHKRRLCTARARKRYVVNTNAKGKKHAGGKRHG
jgi:WD40-like Beta Propeller Repeat